MCTVFAESEVISLIGKGTPREDIAYAVIESVVELSLIHIFLVCLAVWIGFSARTVADKVLGILLPISAFVACGFEHCVANMFFLPMGLLLNSMGVGAPDAVTLAGIATNLSACLLYTSCPSTDARTSCSW